MHIALRQILNRGLLPFAAATAATLGTLAAPLGAAAAPAASPSTANCTLTGTTRACDLWAKSGTLTLPGGGSVAVWGYADSATGAAQVPGPTLVVNQGEKLQVTLHNTLADPSGLAFPAQTGAAGAPADPNSAATYSFTADHPGISIYEAGLTPRGPRQVAMGLAGALIVRPSGAAATDEAVVVLGDLDTTFNAHPTTADLRAFNPGYRLINGKAFPSTDPIAVQPGHTILLRYVNAGLTERSVGLIGLRQKVMAIDGRDLSNRYVMSTETIPAGASMDTQVVIPAATPGTRYTLHDAAALLHNAGARKSDGTVAFGGMLTFLTVAGNSGTDTVGPATSNVLLNPSVSAPGSTTPVTLTATITDTSTGGSNIKAAEYFIDTVGTNGAGAALADTTTPTFNSPVVNVSGSIDVSKLAAGNHTVYVHGQDAANNWGPNSTAVLTIGTSTDTVGPTTSAVALTPSLVKTTDSTTLKATLSDVASGNSVVTAGEYFVDTLGADGSGSALTGDATSANGTFTSPTVDTSTSISATSLSNGAHTIYVHGKDAAGNWGHPSSGTLKVDSGGPVSSAVHMTPNPANGTLDIALNATASDSTTGGQTVTAAEYFIDPSTTPPPATGTGTAFAIGTAASVVSLDATIPAAAIQSLTEGPHSIAVRAQDSLGMWGGFATASLAVDKTGPATGTVTLQPNPNDGTMSFDPNTPPPTDGSPNANGVKISTTVTDTASPITRVEGFVDTVGATGTGFQFTPVNGTFSKPSEGAYTYIALSSLKPLAEGPRTISVRGLDAAGNWGPVTTATLVLDRTPPTLSNVVVIPSPTTGAQATLTATATDLATAIFRAEYFEGTLVNGTSTSDPGLGKATPMSAADGAFNSTTEGLTATLDLRKFAVGPHTLLVRARDGFGHWSPLSSVTFTSTLLFADSFESNDLTRWGPSTGTAGLSVQSAAAMGGTPNNPSVLGLRVNADAAPHFVTKTLGAAEANSHIRFYFNPNGVASSAIQDIFAALNAGNGAVFRVQYRTINTGAAQVRVLVAGGAANPAWQTITNAAHALEVGWQSGTTGQATLYIDGVQAQVQSGSTGSVRSVRLGLANGSQTTGAEYLDAFVWTRGTALIGP